MKAGRRRLEKMLIVTGAVTTAILVLVLTAWAVSEMRDWRWALILAAVVVVCAIGSRLARKRIPKGSVIEIDLDNGVVERTGSDPISRAMSRRSVTVRDVVDALDRGRNDPRVSGLVARLGNGKIDLGHAQELRDAVHRFRGAGKRAIAFAEVLGEQGAATVDYYLASSFSEIYLQPMGIASIEGLVARSSFLRGLFDRFGLVPDFEHRKEYKAAKYLLTETGFTEPHRESLDAVAGDRFSQVVAGIAADRAIDPERVNALIDSAPLTADEALAGGLVDHLGHRDAAYGAAGEKARFIFHDRYLKRAGRPHRKGERIALIYGTGSIARGRSGFDPLTGGSSLGADEVADAFRQATDNPKIKAIVFRVDSPGGSAVASQIVSHELARARESGKPVVVSMGNVAGSGGYWVAANANRIVAQPGTITGSIGVVWGKLATREAWARLGVTFDQIPYGLNSTFGTAQDVYSDSERERLNALIDDTYQRFVDHVASGRGLSAEQVEEIARGRIWTGSQARANGLVDELGGLDRAVELARDEAGIEPDRDLHLVIFPTEKTLPLPERSEGSDPVHEALATALDALGGVRDFAPGLQARMPWIRFR